MGEVHSRAAAVSRFLWLGVYASLVFACGGEIAGPVLDAGAQDAVVDRAPRNACEPLSGPACQVAGCLALTKPNCPSDVLPLGDGGHEVTRLACVPALDCIGDANCPTGQRCLIVRYSRCAGVGCTADGEAQCTQRPLCVYPDFP